MLNNLTEGGKKYKSGFSRKGNAESRSSRGNEVVLGTETESQDYEMLHRKTDKQRFLSLIHRKFPALPSSSAFICQIYNPRTSMRNKRFQKQKLIQTSKLVLN